jgi:hypothetical protein
MRMSLGKAALLLTLTVAAFLALSVKEHRDALKEWEATVADLRRQLVHSRGEVTDLKTLNSSISQKKPSDRVEEMRVAAEELEKAAALLADERDRASALQRDLHLAHKIIEDLKEQPSTGSVDLKLAAVGQKSLDDARQMEEAQERITTLTRELGEAHQEIQRSKEQGAAALEQANRRAREREAALSRDIRSARKALHRANEQKEAASESGGQSITAHIPDSRRSQLGR